MLAPLLNAPVEPNAYVTVIGEVVRFDAADAAARMKDAMPSLAPEVAAKYRGRPAIIATSVINGAMTDLARKLPPPMSPEELALSKVMKQVGPGFTALRTAATASNGAETTAQSAALVKLFGEAVVFWKAQAAPRRDQVDRGRAGRERRDRSGRRQRGTGTRSRPRSRSCRPSAAPATASTASAWTTAPIDSSRQLK